MTRYIVKGLTACNQHLFTDEVEAPTKTLAEMYLFDKFKQSAYDAVMVALTAHVDVREVVCRLIPPPASPTASSIRVEPKHDEAPRS